MGGNANNLKNPLLHHYPVNHSVLYAETERTKSLPFSPQSFITKPFDQTKTRRTRNSRDVFPFFIALEDLEREDGNLLANSPVFVDLPNAGRCYVYLIRYVKLSG